MNKFGIASIALIVLLGGSMWLSKSAKESSPDSISSNGLHAHPILEIYIKGEKQIIPPNIGIGAQFATLPMGMAPIHTHNDAHKELSI